ncbi:MAG: hypothetical protein AAFZ87_21155, partial [Planctomycetota bacterium]
QYESLRQEELLFRIAEEVRDVRVLHEIQARALTELDAGRKKSKPTRSERIQLGNIAREEEALGGRIDGLVEAIRAEGSLVFAEVLDRASRDLARVARELPRDLGPGRLERGLGLAGRILGAGLCFCSVGPCRFEALLGGRARFRGGRVRAVLGAAVGAARFLGSARRGAGRFALCGARAFERGARFGEALGGGLHALARCARFSPGGPRERVRLALQLLGAARRLVETAAQRVF